LTAGSAAAVHPWTRRGSRSSANTLDCRPSSRCVNFDDLVNSGRVIVRHAELLSLVMFSAPFGCRNDSVWAIDVPSD